MAGTMTQNIYDDPEFFAGYSRLSRSVEGLAGVDLGCGFGWFCRWAREQGAAQILGLDVSEKMLAQARAETSDSAITYRRADLERLDLPEASFDLAYSSLVLHYVENLKDLLATVHHALVPGAYLVFSAEHPIFTAPTPQGWSIDAEGRKRWPVDNYLVEGPRRTDWLAQGVVKQHRTIGTYLNLLIGLGFTITHVEEWGPTDAQIAARPALAEERQRPMFWLAAARR
jgi:SAM-dependent methyltransferase